MLVCASAAWRIAESLLTGTDLLVAFKPPAGLGARQSTVRDT